MIPHISGSQSYSNYSESTKFTDSQLHKGEQGKASATDTAHQTNDSQMVSRAEGFDIDALVTQIWGFASARIEKAKSEGASAEELESMWKAAESGVKQGFGEAKEVLDEMGEGDEALTMKIDSAYGQIMDKLADRDLNTVVSVPEKQDNHQHPKAHQASGRAIGLYQYERQTFELNLTTQQGDKILIQAINEQESSAFDVKEGRFSSTTWGTRQESGFSLVIKGDLNEKESADLDALLAQVNELANEFYEGDYGVAFDMASALNIDGTSLRSMNLNMQEVEQKAATVYSEASDKPHKLPKGLEPLKAYADKLISAQEAWFDKFNSEDSFLTSLRNHPLNDQSLGKITNLLLN